MELTLFDNNTIVDRFATFHKNNPRVYLLFCKFCKQLLDEYEFKRIGARMVMERVRWECFTSGRDERGYKINNYFIAHYARKFLSENPQYEGRI